MSSPFPAAVAAIPSSPDPITRRIIRSPDSTYFGARGLSDAVSSPGVEHTPSTGSYGCYSIASLEPDDSRSVLQDDTTELDYRRSPDDYVYGLDTDDESEISHAVHTGPSTFTALLSTYVPASPTYSVGSPASSVGTPVAPVLSTVTAVPSMPFFNAPWAEAPPVGLPVLDAPFPSVPLPFLLSGSVAPASVATPIPSPFLRATSAGPSPPFTPASSVASTPAASPVLPAVTAAPPTSVGCTPVPSPFLRAVSESPSPPVTTAPSVASTPVPSAFLRAASAAPSLPFSTPDSPSYTAADYLRVARSQSPQLSPPISRSSSPALGSTPAPPPVVSTSPITAAQPAPTPAPAPGPVYTGDYFPRSTSMSRGSSWTGSEQEYAGSDPALYSLANWAANHKRPREVDEEELEGLRSLFHRPLASVPQPKRTRTTSATLAFAAGVAVGSIGTIAGLMSIAPQ